MNTREQMLEILQKAYQIEVDGFTFYSMTAEKATKPAVKELFQKLADDEVQHQNFLKGIGKKYRTEGDAAFHVVKPDWSLKGFTGPIFTKRFQEQAHGAAFEMGALSVGLTLETNAMAHFNKAADGSDSKDVADFYRFLADWEKGHYDALNNLLQGIRSDFWGEGGFSPF